MDTSTVEEMSRNPEDDQCMGREQKQAGIRERMKDAEYRNKMIHSLCISASFFVLGINCGQLGPTLLDLQILTDVGLERASAFFTLTFAGSLSGACICGLIYAKINSDLLMFFSVTATATIAFITPFCSYFELMLAVRFLAGFTFGLIDTCGNALQIKIWGREGEGLMQFLHFCFAFGGVLSPLFSEPFLAPKITESGHQANGSMDNATNSNYSNILTTSLPEVPQETDVKYAFFISAALSVFFAVPFLPLYVKNKNRLEGGKVEANRNQRKLPRPIMFLTVIMLSIFFWIYCCVEDSFASFLMTFLVKEYDSVSKSKGAFVTAVYWGSFATARFLMVFLCRILSSLQLLIICISLMVVSFTGFLICAHLRIVDALIGFSALSGLAMSAVYPAAYSWTEAELLKVNGFVAGSFQGFATLAGMLNPLILGHLMEGYGNMWFSYLLLGQTICLAILFLVILVFARVYLNKKFGLSTQLPSPEGDVTVQNSFLDSDLKEVDENC